MAAGYAMTRTAPCCTLRLTTQHALILIQEDVHLRPAQTHLLVRIIELSVVVLYLAIDTLSSRSRLHIRLHCIIVCAQHTISHHQPTHHRRPAGYIKHSFRSACYRCKHRPLHQPIRLNLLFRHTFYQQHGLAPQLLPVLRQPDPRRREVLLTGMPPC